MKAAEGGRDCRLRQGLGRGWEGTGGGRGAAGEGPRRSWEQNPAGPGAPRPGLCVTGAEGTRAMAGRGARGGGGRKLRAGGRERGKGTARQRQERAGRRRLQESRAGTAPGAGELGVRGPDGPASDPRERRRLPAAFPGAMGQAPVRAPRPRGMPRAARTGTRLPGSPVRARRGPAAAEPLRGRP